MRRLLALSTALVLALSAGAQFVSADTTGGGGCFGPGQCRTTGLGADAGWSNYPADGPVVGVVYTDTWISASSYLSRAQGQKSGGAGAWFDIFRYTFDANLNFIPVGETFVADPGTVTFTADRKLGSATVSGTAMAVTCTIDAQGNETCGNPVATAINATWTATGPRMQSVFTSHQKGPGMTANQTFQGANRQAAASASIGGVAVTGASMGADINDSQSNSIWICHTTGC